MNVYIYYGIMIIGMIIIIATFWLIADNTGFDGMPAFISMVICILLFGAIVDYAGMQIKHKNENIATQIAIHCLLAFNNEAQKEIQTQVGDDHFEFSYI